ncbi:hypothetical protein H8959_014032 [Pygathrix nigripes]
MDVTSPAWGRRGVPKPSPVPPLNLAGPRVKGRTNVRKHLKTTLNAQCGIIRLQTSSYQNCLITAHHNSKALVLKREAGHQNWPITDEQSPESLITEKRVIRIGQSQTSSHRNHLITDKRVTGITQSQTNGSPESADHSPSQFQSPCVEDAEDEQSPNRAAPQVPKPETRRTLAPLHPRTPALLGLPGPSTAPPWAASPGQEAAFLLLLSMGNPVTTVTAKSRRRNVTPEDLALELSLAPGQDGATGGLGSCGSPHGAAGTEARQALLRSVGTRDTEERGTRTLPPGHWLASDKNGLKSQAHWEHTRNRP